jgi:hypothetical protein
MKKETFYAVEKVLKAYPKLKAALTDRERYLEAAFRRDNLSPGMGGRLVLTEPERMTDIKNGDVEYCELLAVVERIADEVWALPPDMRLNVDRCYFCGDSDWMVSKRLRYEETTVRDKRIRAVREIRDCCIQIRPMVLRCMGRIDKNKSVLSAPGCG